MSDINAIISYIVWKGGCLHPFRISRILMLVEWEYEGRYGKRLTDLKYVCEPFGFYIEGFSELIKGNPCLRKKKLEKEKACLEYVCENEPKCKDVIREVIDGILEKVKRLDDVELNRLVIRDERYKRYLVHGKL